MALVFNEISNYMYYLIKSAYIVLSIQINEPNTKVKKIINKS